MSGSSMTQSLVRAIRVAGLKHAARTAVAVILTESVVTWLGLPQGYWAVITVVIVMQANIGGSIKAGWARLAGTAVGAASGAVAHLLGGDSLVSLGLAVMLTLSVCTLVRQLRNSMRVAGITVVIVLLAGHGDESAPVIALTRFSEIAVGIIMALVVSTTLWPSRASRAISRGMAKILEDISSLFVLVVEGQLAERYPETRAFALKDSIVRTLARCRDLCQEADLEDRGDGSTKRSMILFRSERLFEGVLSMDHIAAETAGPGLHRHLPEELTTLKTAVATVLTSLAASLRDTAALPELPPLETAVRAAREKLSTMRQDRAPAAYALSEVLGFYSFMYGMLACAAEALEITGRLALMEKK